MRRLAILAVTTGLCLSSLATASASAAAPVISLTTVSSATETSVVLEADINPGGKATEYHFEYGPEDCVLQACAQTPGEVLLKAESPQRVKTLLEGLAPGTTYHLRVVARNGDGEIPGPDRTFTTYAPTAIFTACSNDAFRVNHPSDRLPDCRAYEQASPIAKNGTDAGGNIFQVQASLAGDAITFLTNSGVPGGEGAQEFPNYISRRGAGSWSTQGLLPAPSFGERANVLGWTPDLAYAFDSAAFAGGFSNALLLRRSADGQIQELVQPTPEALYVFGGASADNSKLFLEAKGAQLTSGAAPGRDNLYLLDRDTGAFSLVGILPDSACASPPCTPPGGSFVGPYDWWAGTNADTLARGGAANAPGITGAPGYFTQEQHAISADGDKVYFTAGDTGQIYLRKGLNGSSPTTAHISASRKTNGTGPGNIDAAGTQPAAFVGASADGSAAFFTSSEKLTNDADTGPEPPPAAIARADLDGGMVEKSFLPAHASAVAVGDGYVYWANPERGAIGRAKLGASGPEDVEEDFIEGADNPQGVAVDSEYVYWTNADGDQPGEGTIGRADLDGDPASVDQTFIPGEVEVGGVMTKVVSDPQGIDVDSAHIYWVNVSVNSGTQAGQVARANLDGGDVRPKLIPCCAWGDIAVSATKLYYSRVIEPGAGSDGFIRRTNLDGTGLEEVGGPNAILSHSMEPPALALDGSHLYFTNPATGVIGSSNLDGSAPQELIKGAGHPQGLAVDGAHIYWSANQKVVPNAGNDLYRYEVDGGAGVLTDLSADQNPSDPNGAEVQGFLGSSEDGSHVYFVANGDLDGAGPASLGNCKRSGSGRFDYSGKCNLYLVRGAALTFIARLDALGDGDISDAANWQPNPAWGANFRQVSTGRVSGDGQTLLFRSREKLSDYDNAGTPELYRFRVGDSGSSCVSCNPSGALPKGVPTLRSIRPPSVKTNVEVKPVLTRNLSADGQRVFFESPEKLVAEDTNGDQVCPLVGGAHNGANQVPACQDVYEWEAQGAGSCVSKGGCLYLLSGGTSPSPSFLGDASASGEDVFIFTREQLVPQDQDTIQDLYDVKALGGLAAQNQPPAQICASLEACHGHSPQPPAIEPPPAFNGPANPKPKRGAKHRRKRHHHHRKHKHTHKHKHGHANRGTRR